MSNDNELVDELENLQKQKKEIENKEEELKQKIIELAKQKNTETLFGTKMKCFIREYERIIYPEDKTEIINTLKQKRLWDEFSMINYSRFGSKASKNEFDNDILNLIKKQKAVMILLKVIEK